MKKSIFLMLLVLIVSGCDNAKCVESHQEQSICIMVTYTYNNDSMTPHYSYYPCQQIVCDKYESVE